jgi:hypothetical protein
MQQCVGVMDCNKVSRMIVERFWESRRDRVKAPYTKSEDSEQDPEYRETRETLREVGGTTPQG